VPKSLRPGGALLAKSNRRTTVEIAAGKTKSIQHPAREIYLQTQCAQQNTEQEASVQRVRRSSAGSGQCSLHSSSGPQDQARRPKFLAAKQHKKLDLQPDNKQQGNTTVFRNEIQRHEPAAAEKSLLGAAPVQPEQAQRGGCHGHPRRRIEKSGQPNRRTDKNEPKSTSEQKNSDLEDARVIFLLNYNKILIITEVTVLHLLFNYWNRNLSS
jgi:hypothetical protein